jgi:hypothetical protein
LTNSLVVGKHSTQPALIYKVHPTATSFFLDGFLGLLFGPDKKNTFSIGHGVFNKSIGLIKLLHRLLQINNINPIALHINIGSHLGIPPAGLMTKVNSCFQQLLHSNN